VGSAGAAGEASTSLMPEPTKQQDRAEVLEGSI
jgi:hypothetical protein